MANLSSRREPNAGGATRSSRLGLTAVATAFGGYGERVGDLADLPGAMKRAFDAGVPACLNVEVDPDIVHPLTNMMLGDVTSTDAIVVPYYENIPR